MIPTEQAPWQQYRPIRGHFIVGLYAYVRWVDNTVDEGNGLSLNQRKDFLQRQMKLVQGNPLKETDAMELMFSGLPWKSVPEKEIQKRVSIIFGAISDDLEHRNLTLRSNREIRHYNWRTIWPVVDGLFLLLNGRLMREDKRFMELLDGYMLLGNLEEIGDDLNQELIKIPLATQSGERMTKPQVLEEIDQKEYNRLKSNAIAKISDNLETVRRLNIPLWQKFALTIYLFEALVKKQILLSRNRAFKGLKE